MSSNRVKIGGWAGVVAAVLFVVTMIVMQVAPVDVVYDSPTDILHQIVLLAAFAATLVAIVGLDARQGPRPRYGRLGTIGTVCTLIGYGVVALIVLAGIVMGRSVLTDIRIAAALAVVVGGILLGIATLRTRDLPWWCGVLLLVAFPLGDLTNALFAGSEGLLLAALWGSVGVALLRRADAPAAVAEQPAAAS